MIGWILLIVIVCGAVGLTLVRPAHGIGWTWLGGLALFFLAHRVYPDEFEGTVMSAVALLLVAGSLAWRAVQMRKADGELRGAQRDALVWQAVGSTALGVWALAARFSSGDSRLGVVLTVLAAILAIVGIIPVLLLDHTIGDHPKAMPFGARRAAVVSGVSLALAIALAFPVNFIADAQRIEADYSYFRVTDPGSATIAIVQSIHDPVEVVLFYPAGNEVKERLTRYFEALGKASGTPFQIRSVDQAADPALARELGVRDNGKIVLVQGDKHETFGVDADIKKAKRALKEFDRSVQKYLLRLARSRSTIYLLTGHGELSPRADNPFGKLGALKRVLNELNYNVTDFGLEQGSADKVPDDAALVIVAAPQKALLDPEIEALKTYVDDGGSLLLFSDVGRDPLTELMSHVGLVFGTEPLANAQRNLRLTGGLADRFNLFSQRFGAHPATATLSRYATRANVAMFGTVDVTEAAASELPGKPKVVALMRSYEDTWVDLNHNGQRDPEEPAGIQVLGQAVEGSEPDHDYRIIAFGDAQIVSDFVLERSEGNAQLLVDSVRWLTHDEALSGETSDESDVRIQHTREQDVAWFYGIIFGMPLLVMLVGGLFVRRRKAD